MSPPLASSSESNQKGSLLPKISTNRGIDSSNNNKRSKSNNNSNHAAPAAVLGNKENLDPLTLAFGNHGLGRSGNDGTVGLDGIVKDTTLESLPQDALQKVVSFLCPRKDRYVSETNKLFLNMVEKAAEAKLRTIFDDNPGWMWARSHPMNIGLKLLYTRHPLGKLSSVEVSHRCLLVCAYKMPIKYTLVKDNKIAKSLKGILLANGNQIVTNYFYREQSVIILDKDSHSIIFEYKFTDELNIFNQFNFVQIQHVYECNGYVVALATLEFSTVISGFVLFKLDEHCETLEYRYHKVLREEHYQPFADDIWENQWHRVAVFLTSDGSVYVIDAKENCISTYDTAGNLTLSVHSPLLVPYSDLSWKCRFVLHGDCLLFFQDLCQDGGCLVYGIDRISLEIKWWTRISSGVGGINLHESCCDKVSNVDFIIYEESSTRDISLDVDRFPEDAFYHCGLLRFNETNWKKLPFRCEALALANGIREDILLGSFFVHSFYRASRGSSVFGRFLLKPWTYPDHERNYLYEMDLLTGALVGVTYSPYVWTISVDGGPIEVDSPIVVDNESNILHYRETSDDTATLVLKFLRW